MKTLLRFALIAVIVALLHPVSAASSLPEYSATEAAKHIGETARLVGMVDCIGHGRRHTDVQIGGCLPHTLLWVVVPDDVSGPELDCGQLRGVTIAVTGKIESPGGIPQVVVKSTEQIVPQTSPNPNYLASANDKENKGDLDGAIADLDRAIELTNDPGTYIERAGVKEKKADFAGAIRDYDELIERSADTNAFTRAEYYQSRAKLKIKKSELDGAIADADSAIRLYPRSPWHYATRGQANEAKGNFVAALNDYQMAIKTEPHNSIYKGMLKHAQAQAAGSRGRNSQPGDSPQSATALVTQAKAKLAAGDFDGAIADCDRALQLSRGGSKEASGLRIQAMRAKGSSKSGVAQRVNPGRSQEEQPIAPTTKSGPAVAAGEARPKATGAILVDPTSGQPIGRETYNGSVKVEYSDGRSEIFCKDGNCADPHVSHEGHVGWTHYTHLEGRRNAAMNERLVIRFSNGQTKEFKPNPNGGPFIEEWNFIDNDVAVAIKSRGHHGPASFVRYDLISGRMTGHQDGYVEYEKMPEWAQPFSDDIPFGLRAPTTEPGPAASKPESAEVVDIPAAQANLGIKAGNAASLQSSLPGTNILGSPAEPGIADVTALVEFTGNGSTNKGRLPNGLIFASDGDIYGTAERGGANDYGTIFKMTTAGAFTTLIEFAGKAPANSSGMPRAGLVEGRDGDFYGTTSGGGVGPTGENHLDNGTVFKLSRSGVLTTLVRFSCNGATNKGCEPYSGLVQAPNGDFYGTTFSGGSAKALPIPISHAGFRGFGTIFKITSEGALTTLIEFSVQLTLSKGGAPWAGLTLAKDGNFYGSTWLGGARHGGTIFKLTPKAAMTTLVNFSGSKPPNKGGGCMVELLQASDGNFYGTCPTAGAGNGGTVFKMTPTGAFTNLVEFANNDSRGVEPYAPLAEGNDGNLYGTTTAGGAFNCGTIFRVTPNGSFKVLWNFNNPNKIQQCEHPATGPLLKDKEGNFYGTTKWGGRTDWGTVFKLALHDSGTQSSAVPTSNSSATASTSDANGGMKIVSQKEQTSKMGSSQSGEQTSEDLGVECSQDRVRTQFTR